MKLALILSTLLAFSVLMATGVEQFTSTGWGVHASLQDVRSLPGSECRTADNDDALDTVSSITRTFALPFQSVSLQLNSISWNVFDAAGTFLYKTETPRDNAISLAKSFTFRELHGFTVRICAQSIVGDLTYTLDAIDFDLLGSGSIDIPSGVSPAFIEAYKALADNWDTCYLRDLPVSRPRMLIISHTQLEPYQAEFVKWKRQLGFEVYVAYKSEIGTSLSQFQDFISDHYNQYQCDYLLLLGDVGNPTTLSSFQLTAGGAEFTILNHSGSMALGQNNQIGFQIKNTGTQELSGVVVTIHSLVNAMQCPNPSLNIANWGIGETRTLQFNLQLASDVYEGRYLPLYFQITGNPEYTSLVHYALTAGTPSANDPTGPCNYGYFAYDSTDLGYSQSPVYQWLEIDPLEPDCSGQASVYTVQDDGSRVLDLPFNFRYFGQTYNQITICSNGWLSFGATDMNDFYNCFIPAALGPKAQIAGYWDDLKGKKTGNSGGGVFDDMRLCYWFDASNNRFIVEWNKAYNQYTIDLMENASLEKFQIILYPQPERDGDILIQYHTVDNPGITSNFCTVGIEDHLASDGLTYTHGNQYPITAAALQAGLAIRFTTVPPDNYVAASDPVLPPQITLYQNYPNPFNPNTTIEFQVDKPGKARLLILNLRGQIVKTLLNDSVKAGKSSLFWDGRDDNGIPVATGLYLYRLEMDSKSETKRMLLLK